MQLFKKFIVAFLAKKYFFSLMFVSCLTLGNRYLIIVKLGAYIVGISGKSKRGEAIVSIGINYLATYLYLD